jgi:hypothetical protein
VDPVQQLLIDSLGANWMSKFTRHDEFELSGDSLGTETSREDAIERCTAMPDCAGVNEGESIHLVGMGLLKRKRGSTAHLSGRFRNIDSYRCLKYLQGEVVERSDKMKDPESAEKTGEWSCVSALVRRGTLGLLGQLPAYIEDLPAEEVSANSTVSFDDDGDWKDSLSWEPPLCGFAKKQGTDNCKVTGIGLQDFKRIRNLPPAPARGRTGFSDSSADVSASLLQSVLSGPLRNLNPGAGKSGSTFASSFDGFHKIKLGLVQHPVLGIDEPRHLMKLVTGENDVKGPGPTIALAEHFQKNPLSAINRVYGMMRLDFGDIKSYSIWMEDAGYNVESQLALADPVLVPGEPTPKVLRYDMKGNRLSRAMQEGSFTLAAQNFFDNVHRFQINDDACLKFRRVLAADNKYLYNHLTFDYSYFVEVVEDANDLSCDVKAPLCIKQDDVLITFTVIDTVREYDFIRAALARSGIYDDFNEKAVVFTNMICPTARERLLSPTYFEKFNKKLSWKCQDDLVTCAHRKASGGQKPGLVTWKQFQKFGKRMGFDTSSFKENWNDVSGIDDFAKLFEK